MLGIAGTLQSSGPTSEEHLYPCLPSAALIGSNEIFLVVRATGSKLHSSERSYQKVKRGIWVRCFYKPTCFVACEIHRQIQKKTNQTNKTNKNNQKSWFISSPFLAKSYLHIKTFLTRITACTSLAKGSGYETPCNYPVSHVIPWDRESLVQHEDAEDITWGHHVKTCYYSVVTLSKAATTHCSSEPWMTCFAPSQDLLANIEILRHKCPYLDHQKEASLRCWNTFLWWWRARAVGKRQPFLKDPATCSAIFVSCF